MKVPRAVLDLIRRRAGWFRRDQERAIMDRDQERARERGLQAVTLEVLAADLEARTKEDTQKP